MREDFHFAVVVLAERDSYDWWNNNEFASPCWFVDEYNGSFRVPLSLLNFYGPNEFVYRPCPRGGTPVIRCSVFTRFFRGFFFDLSMSFSYVFISSEDRGNLIKRCFIDCLFFFFKFNWNALVFLPVYLRIVAIMISRYLFRSWFYVQSCIHSRKLEARVDF